MIANETRTSDFCELDRQTQFIVLAKLEGLTNREIAILLDREQTEIDAELDRVIRDWKVLVAPKPEDLPTVDPSSVSQDEIRQALRNRANPGPRYSLAELYRRLASRITDAK